LRGPGTWAGQSSMTASPSEAEDEACRTGKLAVHAQAGPGDEAGHSSPLASPILLGINALGEKYFPSTLQKLAFKSHCDPFLLEIRGEFRMIEWPLRCLYKDIPPSAAFPVLCAVMGPGLFFDWRRFPAAVMRAPGRQELCIRGFEFEEKTEF